MALAHRKVMLSHELVKHGSSTQAYCCLKQLAHHHNPGSVEYGVLNPVSTERFGR
jgi:hypothetical protein